MVQEDSRQPHAVFGGTPASNPPGRAPAGDPFLAILCTRSGKGRH